MAEGEEPAEGIRPSLCHALDAALVGEAHREQEGKLDAGEGVVGDSKRRGREDGDGPARIVRGGRERLANGGGEEERRLAMEEVLVARTFAHAEHFGHRGRLVARAARGGDPERQLLVRGDDAGGGAAAGSRDVVGVEVRGARRVAPERFSGLDAGRILLRRVELARRDAFEERDHLGPRHAGVAPHGVHEQVADGQHVEAARLVVLSEHGPDLVLRGVSSRDDLPCDDDDGGGLLRVARGAHRLGEGPGTAVGGAHHVLRHDARG